MRTLLVYKQRSFSCTLSAPAPYAIGQIKSGIVLSDEQKSKEWIQILSGLKKCEKSAKTDKSHFDEKLPIWQNYDTPNTALSSSDFEQCKSAYQKFISNPDNLGVKDMYVVFVNGILHATGNSRLELIKKVYGDFGNIAMYVGRVSPKAATGLISSPMAP